MCAAACGLPLAARAEEAPPRLPPERVVPEIEKPDQQLQRPLDVPLRVPESRSRQLLERGRLENQRQRLERGSDRHDPRVQDRMRRLDRGIDRLR